MNTGTITDKIELFLQGLGFTISHGETKTAFLPGIQIMKDSHIRIDSSRVSGVGDVLHEAGHLAVIPSIFRNRVSGNVEEGLEALVDDYMATHSFINYDSSGMPTENPTIRAILQAGEQEAQAWSYAASIAAKLDPEVVFHVNQMDSYGGDAEGLLLCLSINQHAGIHGLSAAGMTTKKMFPKMIKWLQD